MIAICIFVLFLVLKLAGVIAWSWLWVTSPLWIGLALAGLLFLIGILFFGVGFIAIGTAALLGRK